MAPLLFQVISGFIIALVSFGFGYFLFRSQTNEQIRLEVYKRRLDCYDKILSYYDDLDFFSHRQEMFPKEEKNAFVDRAFRLHASTSAYIPPGFDPLLRYIVDCIDGLPESLADLEDNYEKVNYLIEKDIGLRLVNWRVSYIKKDATREYKKHFED